jgi:hypothetical protein
MSRSTEQFKMVTVTGYEGSLRVSLSSEDTMPSINYGINLVESIRDYVCNLNEERRSIMFTDIKRVYNLTLEGATLSLGYNGGYIRKRIDTPSNRAEALELGYQVSSIVTSNGDECIFNIID